MLRAFRWIAPALLAPFCASLIRVVAQLPAENPIYHLVGFIALCVATPWSLESFSHEKVEDQNLTRFVTTIAVGVMFYALVSYVRYDHVQWSVSISFTTMLVGGLIYNAILGDLLIRTFRKKRAASHVAELPKKEWAPGEREDLRERLIRQAEAMRDPTNFDPSDVAVRSSRAYREARQAGANFSEAEQAAAKSADQD